MEESAEEPNIDPELYFLIAKFLSSGPLKESAKTLVRELNDIGVLPRRLDWLGNEHAQTYDELACVHADMSGDRLARLCRRLLQLARPPPPRLAPRPSLLSLAALLQPAADSATNTHQALVKLLSERELGRSARPPLPARLLRGLQLQRRTLGHLSAVYCLVFDVSGRYVITGADDMLIKVWCAIEGRLVACLRGAGAEITDAAVSGDGALLAAGSVERRVRVWELRGGAPRAVLAAHQGTITAVRWAPPAHEVRWLASTSTDGSVAFWTCSADGHFLSQPVQYVERMRPGACHMICAAWSPGGSFLAAGSADHHVRVYAVHDAPGPAPAPRRVLEVQVHSDAVDSIAWAHTHPRFVTGSKDGTAALWSFYATQWRHILLVPEVDQKGKESAKGKVRVTMVAWDRSDRWVLTAVSDATVRVWAAGGAGGGGGGSGGEWGGGRQVRVLRAHRDDAYVLEPHPSLAGVVLSAGHDGKLIVWDVETGESLVQFNNIIDGQGEGAIFDAKWGGDATIAASDSHGHLLLLGLGAGHPRLQELPLELFFHTDYRPLVRDALGGVLDEQTEIPPHLLPPPFLVDVEGAPYPPHLQRLVPGREGLPPSLLSPAPAPAGLAPAPANPGVWRGEGVRNTPGDWADELPPSTRPIVPPLQPSVRQKIEQRAIEMNKYEQAWYRREMRRRPLMISTAGAEKSGPPRRRVRKPPAPRPPPVAERPPTSESSSSSAHSSQHSELDLSSGSSSSGSQYSDWEAGSELAPPARARRRPAPARRYTPPPPPPPPPPRRERAARGDTTQEPVAEEGEEREGEVEAEAGPSAEAEPPPRGGTPEELPACYRVGEWLTAVTPRKAPYHPQMGDHCMYFRLGHQRYFEAVAEKDLYRVNPRDKPWERTHVYECEPVKVVGIKYVIKPPRIACLKLVSTLGGRSRSFTVRYHDMPDVIDFLVLKQQVEAGVARRWAAGDRFRCMIDDQWWCGVVVDRPEPDPPPAALSPPARWAAMAAAQFLSVRVRWDNGELERLSPWDLEPAGDRAPPAPGAALPVLPDELKQALYQPQPGEWAGGSREAACGALARLVAQVMSLAAAEPFVAPVDLQRYPSYAKIIPYPIDLATIKARFENLFYRRAAAAQWDVRHIAGNAERYNEAHSRIVRQARLVTDLLLRVIERWPDADVLADYKALAADYRSEEDIHGHDHEQPASRRRDWYRQAEDLLKELCSSPDAEPFREAVCPETFPDYALVVARPLHLGAVAERLRAGHYRAPADMAADIRLVFANSRLYNTNKRSRIYSMTVRLSALFEALWARMDRRPRRRHAAVKLNGYVSGGSSSSEPLAVTSRRRHARHASRHARRDERQDSWDSDEPLHTHRKGKGVGKKSKSKSSSSTALPEPSTSTSVRRDNNTDDEEYVPERNGDCSAEEEEEEEGGGAGGHSSSSHYTNIEVLEEELEDDMELTYDTDRQSNRVRKRVRSSVSSEYSAPPSHRTHRTHRKRTRIRERFTEGSSSSSSASPSPSDDEGGTATGRAAAEGGRYESDRSYKPRYSTDDDAPLLLYRQRSEGGEAGAGPSGSAPRGQGRRARLRRRRRPRYNEDSEEDSALAISKRRALPGALAGALAGALSTSVSQRGRVRTLTHKARASQMR